MILRGASDCINWMTKGLGLTVVLGKLLPDRIGVEQIESLLTSYETKMAPYSFRLATLHTTAIYDFWCEIYQQLYFYLLSCWWFPLEPHKYRFTNRIFLPSGYFIEWQPIGMLILFPNNGGNQIVTTEYFMQLRLEKICFIMIKLETSLKSDVIRKS